MIQFAAVTFATAFVRLALGPLAGTLIDRLERRRVMVTADVAAAAVLGVAAWGLTATHLTWVTASLTAAGIAAAAAFRLPAFSATIPLVVPEERLGSANGFAQLGQGIAQLAAPPLAGLLLITGGLRSILLIDGATFVVSAVLIAVSAAPDPAGEAVPDPAGETAGGHEEFSQQFREGIRFLRSRSGLFHLMLLFILSNFLIGMVEVLAPPMTLALTNPGGLGVVLAVAGSGMLVGAIVMSVWGGPGAKARGALLAMLLEGGCIIALGLRPNLVLIAGAGLGIFFAISVDQACTMALFQRAVPKAMQGRVFSLSTMLASVALPAGYLLAGPLARVFEPLLAPSGALAGSAGVVVGVGRGRGIAVVLCLLGAVFVAATLVALRVRSIRVLDMGGGAAASRPDEGGADPGSRPDEGGVDPGSRPDVDGADPASRPVDGGAYPGPRAAPAQAASPAAYVIFTSGSTGEPKAAVLEQRGLVNHLESKIEDLDLTERDVVLFSAPLSFDICVWQMLAPLAAGACVAAAGDGVAENVAELAGHMRSAGVTIAEVVPAVLGIMLRRELDLPPQLRAVLSGGEALPAAAASAWLGRYPDIALFNAYGPTECSDDVAHHRVASHPPAGASAPIGGAIRNTLLYVLDEQGREVPLGAPGYLFAGGVGVGRGYLGDPRRTAEAFLPDPFAPWPGARMYATGDVVVADDSGVLTYLGRRDSQVKIAGQRVEIGEVEAALKGLDGVEEVAVIPVAHDGATRLEAFAASGASPPPSPAGLRAAVRSVLPLGYVPAVIHVLPELPRTRAGKVDAAALRAMAAGAAAPGSTAAGGTVGAAAAGGSVGAAATGSVGAAAADGSVGAAAGGPVGATAAGGAAPPVGELETELAGLWRDVLGLPAVGRDEHFLDIGGTSLAALQIASEITGRFGCPLRLRDVVASGTVRELAGLVLTRLFDAVPEDERTALLAEIRGM